jgi:hypothetical protein
MSRGGTDTGVFNVAVAVWWIAQFNISRVEYHGDWDAGYGSQSMRRRFLSTFRREADTFGITIPGVDTGRTWI